MMHLIHVVQNAFTGKVFFFEILKTWNNLENNTEWFYICYSHSRLDVAVRK